MAVPCVDGKVNDFYKDISLYRGLSQLAEKLARDIERQDLIVTEKESAFKEAHPNLTDDEINYCRLAESRDEINAKLKTLTEQQKQEPDNRGLKRQKELLQDKLIGIHKELKENPFFKKSIDDQKAARNQYSTCKEELGSIETLRVDFFSNVSHEIKTPIAVIQNSAEMLKKPDLSEDKRQEYVDSITNAAKRLNTLITNILKLNKLEKQSITPNVSEFDLCDQLVQSALLFETVWEEKGIEFEADIADERKLITADAELLPLV